MPRFKTYIYRVAAGVLSLYGVIAIVMIVGRLARIRPDGVCIIGLPSAGYALVFVFCMTIPGG